MCQDGSIKNKAPFCSEEAPILLEVQNFSSFGYLEPLQIFLS